MFCVNEMHLSGYVKWLRELTTKTGTKMASFRIEGHKVYIDCVCFNEIAEAVLSGYGDGDSIEVFGKVQNSTYTKQDGTQVYNMQCAVNKLGAVAEGAGVEQPDPVEIYEAPQPSEHVEPRAGVQDYKAGPF